MEAILPAAPTSLQQARNMLGTIRNTPDELLENAKLVLTELLANEIKHGRYPPGESLVCRVERTPGALRVEVGHHGNDFTMPATAVPRTLQLRETGWGLALITNLSDRWGMQDRDGERLVWAEIDIPRPPSVLH